MSFPHKSKLTQTTKNLEHIIYSTSHREDGISSHSYQTHHSAPSVDKMQHLETSGVPMPSQRASQSPQTDQSSHHHQRQRLRKQRVSPKSNKAAEAWKKRFKEQCIVRAREKRQKRVLKTRIGSCHVGHQHDLHPSPTQTPSTNHSPDMTSPATNFTLHHSNVSSPMDINEIDAEYKSNRESVARDIVSKELQRWSPKKNEFNGPTSSRFRMSHASTRQHRDNSTMMDIMMEGGSNNEYGAEIADASSAQNDVGCCHTGVTGIQTDEYDMNGVKAFNEFEELGYGYIHEDELYDLMREVEEELCREDDTSGLATEIMYDEIEAMDELCLQAQIEEYEEFHTTKTSRADIDESCIHSDHDDHYDSNQSFIEKVACPICHVGKLLYDVNEDSIMCETARLGHCKIASHHHENGYHESLRGNATSCDCILRLNSIPGQHQDVSYGQNLLMNLREKLRQAYEDHGSLGCIGELKFSMAPAASPAVNDESQMNSFKQHESRIQDTNNDSTAMALIASCSLCKGRAVIHADST